MTIGPASDTQDMIAKLVEKECYYKAKFLAGDHLST
jgi:hypothetical protein